MVKIRKVIGREIIDSRGFPTVEAEIYTGPTSETKEFGTDTFNFSFVNPFASVSFSQVSKT